MRYLLNQYNTNNGVLFGEKYDAWIYGNFPFGNGELIVEKSEQVKHIENRGGEYTGPNIYHHIDKKVSGTGNLLDEIPKEGATTQ
jgi:hypothetical protein